VANTLKIWPGGTVNLNDGLIVADRFELAGGTFNTAAGGALRVNSLVGFGSTPSFAGSLHLGHAGGTGSGSHTVAVGESLSTQENLFVGYNAAGSLAIEQGGDVSSGVSYIGLSNDSSGEVTVDGSGSTWNMGNNRLFVGHGGHGILDITDGGEVNSGYSFVGWSTGSQGAVTVRGADSIWSPLIISVAGGFYYDNAARFGSGGTGDLHFSESATVFSHTAHLGYAAESTGTATVDGATWTSTGTLSIGRGGTGSLAITGGGSVTSDIGQIGSLVDSDGSVTIDGAGSQWTSSGSLYVGGSETAAGGAGRLTVGEDATVTVVNTLKIWTDGTVNVNDGGLIIADVLEHAGGTLNTAAGSTLRVNAMAGFGDAASVGGDLLIGHTGGSGSGAHLVDSGQTLSVGERLVVGYDAESTLDVQNGGEVSCLNAFVGDGLNSTGTVMIDNATLTPRDDLYVGREGTGTLNVRGGGQVTARRTFLGYTDDGRGTLTVENAVWINRSAINVGMWGNGTVNVRQGGHLTSDVGNIGQNAGSDGSVTVENPGSTWTVADSLYVGGREDAEGGVGRLDVGLSGTVDVAGKLKLWGQGEVNVDDQGTVVVADEIELAGGTLNAAVGSTVRVNALSGFPDATSFGGSFHLGHAGGTGAGSHFMDAGQSLHVHSDLVVGYDAPADFQGWGVSTGNAYIGHGPDSHGSVTVPAASGFFVGSLLFVGYRGTGTFTVEEGAMVGADYGLLGWDDGSQGTLSVTGPNARMEFQSLYVGGGYYGGDYFDGIDYFGGAGTGILSISNEAIVVSLDGAVAQTSDSSGQVTVDGATWNNSNDLYVGVEGTGTLSIVNGGEVSNGWEAGVGWSAGSDGTVTVDGGTWSSKWLTIGNEGVGTLEISGGGHVDSFFGVLGALAGGDGSVTVDGGTWTIDDQLDVGDHGTGVLVITGGGVVHSGRTYIGPESGSKGTVTVRGLGSQWDLATHELSVGLLGNATLDVLDGALVLSGTAEVGSEGPEPARVTVDGNGSIWDLGDGSLHVGVAGSGELIVRNGAEVSSMNASLGWHGERGTVTVDGATLTIHQELFVGDIDIGELVIQNGGTVVSPIAYIGRQNGSHGTVTMEGPDASWTKGNLEVGSSGTGTLIIRNGPDVYEDGGNVYVGRAPGSEGTVTLGHATWTHSNDFFVGDSGRGTLEVTGESTLITDDTYIGNHADGDGSITIDGADWNNAADLYVGGSGNGQFVVQNGGQVSNAYAFVGHDAGSLGTVTVEHGDSIWECREHLAVGRGGTGTLTVAAYGTLDVRGKLTVWPTGSLSVDDGEVIAASLEILNATGLRIAEGAVRVADDVTIASGGSMILEDNAEFSATSLDNYGTLRGDGIIDAPIVSHDVGTIRVATADYLEFSGNGPNANHGQINVLGGIVEFASPLTNENDGVISGRGGMIFDGGMANHGAVNLGGDTDIYGDVVNGLAGELGTDGEIVVSGNASVAFHDSVIHNGAKFKVSPNADVVFFGPLSGAGAFTGGGGVWIEDNYSPGNSPAWVVEDVDVSLGSACVLAMELTGYSALTPDGTQYDVLQIHQGHLLTLDGTLQVELADGFKPRAGAVFDVFRHGGGDRIGKFQSLSLPTWSEELYFDVRYGDTAVSLIVIPEPSTFVMLAVGSFALLAYGRRKRRRR